MTLESESPLFVHARKLESFEASPRSHSNESASPPQQAPRISFSITEILKPDFGNLGTDRRCSPPSKDTSAKLAPSPIPVKDVCSLQSYYNLYQQRYAQYMYHGLPVTHVNPQQQQQQIQPPHPFLIPPTGLYPHPHHLPQFPHQPHHVYRTAATVPQASPPPTKRLPSPPPPPPAKHPRRHAVVEPKSPPHRNSDPASPVCSPRGEEKDGEEEGKDGMMWPAWVYCTRYSDRPSAGPRSRKMKRRDKVSSSSSSSQPSSSTDEKRPRTAFTNDQLDFLRREFDDNKYLTEERRQRLAKQLDLTESQIKIWFQNKRAKLKKTSGGKNALTMSLIAQGLYNHTPNTDDSQTSDDRTDSDIANVIS